MRKRPKNWRRELIKQRMLTRHLPALKMTERDKSIIESYSAGLTLEELGKQYELPISRVSETIDRFFDMLSKARIYRYWKDELYFDLLYQEILEDVKRL